MTTISAEERKALVLQRVRHLSKSAYYDLVGADVFGGDIHEVIDWLEARAEEARELLLWLEDPRRVLDKPDGITKAMELRKRLRVWLDNPSSVVEPE